MFHYWADGDYAPNDIAPEPISEIDTRHAAAMFARLGELADLPLSAARQPRQRLVEPEIDDGHTDPADGASFDALVVPLAGS